MAASFVGGSVLWVMVGDRRLRSKRVAPQPRSWTEKQDEQGRREGARPEHVAQPCALSGTSMQMGEEGQGKGEADKEDEEGGADKEEYEEVEVEVEVEVPKFKPLPGLLVFPNLPLLGFWIFGAGQPSGGGDLRLDSVLIFLSVERRISCGSLLAFEPSCGARSCRLCRMHQERRKGARVAGLGRVRHRGGGRGQRRGACIRRAVGFGSCAEWQRRGTRELLQRGGHGGEL